MSKKSLVCVCVCFAGPLGAALCNAYDARVVVMTGGCLAALGLIIASQATCLAHLYLTMGVLSGNKAQSKQVTFVYLVNC